MATLPPTRQQSRLWRRWYLHVLAKVLLLLVFTSCLVNISYLGRQLGVQQSRSHSSSPLSSIEQPRRLLPPRNQHQRQDAKQRQSSNISLPLVYVDDAFSAEDASYSESEDEEEEESEDEEAEEAVAAVNVGNVTRIIPNASVSADAIQYNETKKRSIDHINGNITKDTDDNGDDDGNGSQNDDEQDGSVEFRLIDLLGSNLTVIAEKRRIFSLLIDAGIDTLDLATIRQLPEWSHISALYYASNRRPIIHGLESCDVYRRTVPMDKRYLGTAGMFNSGSNALSFLLRQNIIMPKKAQWQVPWSKHRLLRISSNHTAPNMQHFERNNVLPVIIIKDIFTWLQSMCKSPYEARWKHGDGHCPNLVPNAYDIHHFPALQGHDSVPVRVKFSGNQTIYWNSLVDLYNEWYREYYEASFPRLIVRFEDLLFAPEDMLQDIADCVGAELAPTITYNTETSKEHGSHTDLLGAMIKIGTGSGRLGNMTEDDLAYVDLHVDETLRRSFDYTASHVQLSRQQDDEVQIE